MRLLNCSLFEAEQIFQNKKIVFFGSGSWLKAINATELMKLKEQFSYVVDNKAGTTVFLGNIELPVYFPTKLREEEDCIVVLTSPVYMYDMYKQLLEMNLKESVVCYSFPFMQMCTPDCIDDELMSKTIDSFETPKIPKIIHSFWFSGEKKPELYQKCVDSWKEKLPDYQIIEWNTDNYDWHKHPFVERAIELKAWAFASDFARLDVLYEYGGIYLDMDVEVLQKFDNLLGNEAILSFSNHVLVDLAVMGSKKGNPLMNQLLSLYDKSVIPNEKNEYTQFFQPVFVREKLIENGIKMNGTLQKIDNATVFPHSFFMPQEHILFRPFEVTEHTYCVHYDNFGWSFSKNNKREKKIQDNNLLWSMIETEQAGD